MTRVGCAACGAVFEQSSERLFCGHCGARVAAGVANLEAYRTGPERFDRVTMEPAYRAAVQHEPVLPVSRELGRPLFSLALGLVIIAAAGPSLARSGDWTVIVVATGLAVFWLADALRAVVVAARRVLSSTRRLTAIVTGDHFTAGKLAGADPCGICDHRVTLRDRDGHSCDVFAPGALMGEVALGDIGIAYLRHDRLVDYRQFDVMAPPLDPHEMPRAVGCAECGAHQRFGPVSDRCAFCGAALPQPDLGEFGARFRAAAVSPAAADACARPIRGGVPSLLPPIAVLFAGAVLGMFFIDLRAGLRDVIAWSPWFLLVLVIPLGPLVVGAVWLWRRSAPHRAGRRNELVVMVRTRSELVSSNEDKHEYRHFATVAAPNGVRRELLALTPFDGRVTRGQVGVAHIRGDWLAGFTPLPV